MLVVLLSFLAISAWLIHAGLGRHAGGGNGTFFLEPRSQRDDVASRFHFQPESSDGSLAGKEDKYMNK